MLLHVDIETYSAADLVKVGMHKYARHISTEITLIAYAFDDGPVEIIDRTQGDKIPSLLRNALSDRAVIKCAHNAAFERTLFEHVLNIHSPAEQWQCTMVQAQTLSLPASLKQLGMVLRLGKQLEKMEGGRALVLKFAKPKKPSKKDPSERWTHENAPEDWAQFAEYCKQDVEAERAIYDILINFPQPT